MKTSSTKEHIHFNCEGLVLAGNVYKPSDFDSKKRYKAIVTGGSLTSVKEQMAGAYAQKLAEYGFIALAFDYRNYGESQGEPRQYEDPALKLKDLEAAVTYLQSLPFVESVGALGVCTSGGNVAYLAAADKRIKAAVVVASHLADDTVIDTLYGSMGKNVLHLRQQAKKAKELFLSTGENKIIPAYSTSDSLASHVGPVLAYYMEETRGAIKEWKNEFSVMGWETWLNFDPVSKAKEITIPVMMIHSDKCALADNAKRFYQHLAGNKELVWDDFDHTDHYDNVHVIDLTMKEAAAFLSRNMD